MALVSPIAALVLIETSRLPEHWLVLEFGVAVLAVAALVTWVQRNSQALAAREARLKEGPRFPGAARRP